MNEVERQALRIVREDLVTAETRLYDHLSTTFQWIMATLFAANAGAIVTLASEDSRFTTPSCAWLLLGIALVLSILVGGSSAFVSLRASMRIAKMRARIDEALLLEDMNVGAELVEFSKRMQPTWKTFAPSYIAGASMLCLAFALAMVGASSAL